MNTRKDTACFCRREIPTVPLQVVLIGMTALLGCSTAPPSTGLMPNPSGITETQAEAKHFALEVNDLAFSKVIAHLQMTLGQHVTVVWDDEMPFRPQTQISLSISTSSQDVFLERLAEQLNRHSVATESFLGPIGYRQRDGEVVLGSELSLLSREVEMRTYYVGDLLAKSSLRMLYPNPSPQIEACLMRYEQRELAEQSPPAPAFGTRPTAGPDQADGLGRETSPSPSTLEEKREDFQSVVEELSGNLELWHSGRFSARVHGSTLYVNAAPRTHDQINAVLHAIRQAHIDRLAQALRDIEVVQLLAKAEQKRLNQQYETAFRLVRDALRVDPNHPMALAAERVLNDTMSRRP